MDSSSSIQLPHGHTDEANGPESATEPPGADPDSDRSKTPSPGHDETSSAAPTTPGAGPHDPRRCWSPPPPRRRSREPASPVEGVPPGGRRAGAGSDSVDLAGRRAGLIPHSSCGGRLVSRFSCGIISARDFLGFLLDVHLRGVTSGRLPVFYPSAP